MLHVVCMVNSIIIISMNVFCKAARFETSVESVISLRNYHYKQWNVGRLLTFFVMILAL